MTGQLVQFAEHGFLDDDGVTYHWSDRNTAHLVDPANRRRLLDRSHTEPRPDGWLYEHRVLADDCVAVTRTRWDDARLYSAADLEKLVTT